MNENDVSAACKQIQDLLKEYELQNIYNMDEKGCQMGGGRTRSNKKAFFACNDKARYQIPSDELELVTILECIAADGSSLAPGFVFSGGTFDLDWFKHNELPLGDHIT